jgi:hypothetical protein
MEDGNNLFEKYILSGEMDICSDENGKLKQELKSIKDKCELCDGYENPLYILTSSGICNTIAYDFITDHYLEMLYNDGNKQFTMRLPALTVCYVDKHPETYKTQHNDKFMAYSLSWAWMDEEYVDNVLNLGKTEYNNALRKIQDVLYKEYADVNWISKGKLFTSHDFKYPQKLASYQAEMFTIWLCNKLGALGTFWTKHIKNKNDQIEYVIVFNPIDFKRKYKTYPDSDSEY